MRSPVVLLLLAVLSAPASAAEQPIIVFLERSGKVVPRGDDTVAIPRFGGGDRAWTAMVACVKEQFSAFQVEIVDQRPRGGEFITAVVGGKASQLGLDDSTTNGIGPYDGSVLRTATVHVFSRVGTGERDVANLCAVTAHEVGHALGLDHEYKCGDVMSYFNDECGPQRFLDVDVPCGEESERACATGDATQNSYRRLAALVGLKGGKALVVEDDYDYDDDDVIDADSSDAADAAADDDEDFVPPAGFIDCNDRDRSRAARSS